jgi:hypothetical protein
MLGSPLVAIQGDGFFNSSNGKLFGFYMEDKYRVAPRLTLTAGLRWDPYLPYTPEAHQLDCWIPGQTTKVYTNAPTGLNYPGDPGCPAGGTDRKLRTFQPRLGLAWDPRGDGKTSFRAAYGMYSMQMGLQTFQGFAAPPWVRTYVAAQPFLSVDNLWASAHYPADPFAGGFNGVGYAPPKDVAFPATPFGIGSISKNYKPGYVQQWTLSFQHAITASDSIEIGYVGTKGTHIGESYDDNIPAYIPGTCKDPITGAPVPCSTTGNEQQRRPYQAFQSIKVLRNDGNSNYNGLEVTYNHRMKWGLFLNSSYSWSKCIDEGSSPASTGSITAIVGLSRRALCDFDQNYVWRSTATWALPQFKGANALVRGVFGNWTASGLLAIDAGQTFSISDMSDPSVTGVSTASGDPLDVADRVPGVPVWVGDRLNYAAFTSAAAGTHGNSGRNAYRAPGYRNIDFSMMKNIPITERWKVVFRAEAFNLLNHTNFFPPQATINSGASVFGTYTVARDPRIMQFSLKVAF